MQEEGAMPQVLENVVLTLEVGAMPQVLENVVVTLEEGAKSGNRPTNCFFLSALHQLEIKGKVL